MQNGTHVINVIVIHVIKRSQKIPHFIAKSLLHEIMLRMLLLSTAGYGVGRIFETNGNVSLPNALSSIYHILKYRKNQASGKVVTQKGGKKRF